MPLQVNECHGILWLSVVLCSRLHRRGCSPDPCGRSSVPQNSALVQIMFSSPHTRLSLHPGQTYVSSMPSHVYKEKRKYLCISLGTDVHIDGIVNMPARDKRTQNYVSMILFYTVATEKRSYYTWDRRTCKRYRMTLYMYVSLYYTRDKRYCIFILHDKPTHQLYYYTRKNVRYNILLKCIMYDTRENVRTCFIV